MKLPWQRRAAPASPPPAEAAARPQPGVEQRSPTLRRALEATFRKERPEVLDLGPMCGDTVVFLADSGARVSVQEFEPPPATAPAGEDGAAPEPLRLDHRDGRFDLVLAWEHIDFVAPARIHEFCQELHRVLADDGRLLLFSVGQGAPGGSPPRPCRFRVLGDDRLVREGAPGIDRPRFVHLTRDLERAMLPLATQALHLQRNQLREFLARKVPLRG